MPTSGAYEFKLAGSAKDGLVKDENTIQKGEWGWIDRTGKTCWLMIFARCPDCGELMTLYRKRGDKEAQGHDIDAQGNISPSVLHSWMYGNPPVERCGFHTQPTRLLGFTDKR